MQSCNSSSSTAPDLFHPHPNPLSGFKVGYRDLNRWYANGAEEQSRLAGGQIPMVTLEQQLPLSCVGLSGNKLPLLWMHRGEGWVGWGFNNNCGVFAHL